jgi:hypothetical protein
MSEWPLDLEDQMKRAIEEMSSEERKQHPMCRGLLDYFPDACAEVANTSFVGNEQHNPGEELHWAREKSTDHADCIVRHLLSRGTHDTDGVRHTAKVAWRALALLQTEIEEWREKSSEPEMVTIQNRETGERRQVPMYSRKGIHPNWVEVTYDVG